MLDLDKLACNHNIIAVIPDLSRLSVLAHLDFRFGGHHLPIVVIMTQPQCPYDHPRLPLRPAAEDTQSQVMCFTDCVPLNIRSNNRITHLPDSLGNMKDLQELVASFCLSYVRSSSQNITNNVLVSLPASLGMLKSLVDLRVSRNKLESLPDGLFSF
jgi:hypothetical protein